ncbi:MAG: sugar ABC transporter permease [Defluviitaleaceae bacterium]|nr:sugar ABC transporter permease [Defluviitaleaceae bacterium]
MKMKRKKINLEREVTFICFIVPAVLLYVMYFIVPMVTGVFYSLTDWTGLSPNANFIGLENYRNLFTDRAFRQSLFFNTWYALLLVIIVLCLSTMLALCVNAKIKGRTFFRGMLFFPAVLSMLTIGMIFGEIYTRAIPTAARVLNIEFFQISVLSRMSTAPFGILFVHVWQGLAIPTVLVLAGLQTIPEEIIESAELDGAGKWKRFTHITIPFLLPVLSVVLILTLRAGMTMFDYAMVMTEGGPAGATRSLTMNIYNLGFQQLRFGYAIAQATMVSIILIGISFLQITITQKRKVY